jgi:tetratricopeptide (TPR) repeat protein
MVEGIQLRTVAQPPRKPFRKSLPITTTILAGVLSLVPFAFAQNSDFDTVSAAAASARASGDTAQAIQLYSRAVELNPQWPDGWWFLGNLQYATDQYAAAQEAFTHFIALTPTAAPAFALRGLCEYEAARYPEALQDLQHALSIGAANQPRNTQILLYHEALLLTRLGRFDEATGKYIPFVQQQAQQASQNPELALAIGLAGLRMPLLPRDVDTSQAEMIAAVGRAAIPVMTGDLPAGQQAFEAVFAKYPTTPNIHYFYGYLLFAAHSDQAIPQFQQEVAVAPHSAIAQAMLAWTAGFTGDYATALPAAEKAVAEDPSLPMGQLMYGRALVETGKPDAGLPYIQKVLSQDPQNLEAHLTLAKAYSKLGRSEDARQERQLCLKMADQGASPGANAQGASLSATR